MTAFSLSAFLRERFLRDHAHLITPWNFRPAATKVCNESLLRRGWMRYDQATKYETVVVPMGTLPEGQTKDHYERINREAMKPVDKPPA